jgi:hypothetical protein
VTTKAVTTKYRMPWLEGVYHITNSLDKSSDPVGTDAAFVTICRVYGFDADTAAPADAAISLLELSIVSSTVRTP